MAEKRFRKIVQALFSFSQREGRRVLLLLPLLVVLCLLFVRLDRPRFEQSFTRYSDRALDSIQNTRSSYSNRANNRDSREYGYGRNGNSATNRENVGSAQDLEQRPESGRTSRRGYELFQFDPNTVSLEELVRLGFSPKQAQVILNYRQAGAVFRVKSDFARCYTVSPEKYAELEPYIIIGESYRYRSQSRPEKHTDVQTKDSASNRRVEPKKHSTESAVGAGSAQGRNDRNKTPALVELNGADSATLVAIRGIGPLTAGQIIRYRETLGGFVSVEQLQEIQGMTERNYLMIRQQIFVDSSEIQKIDINFASPKRMQGHPYLPPKVLNKILKYRQLKGGWSSTEELIEQHILPAELAVKLAPYLRFGTR